MADFTFYTAPTANGYKISIVLEELELDYSVRYLKFDKNEQKTEEFLLLNPNGRIPVIVDHTTNDYVLSESGAILLYLAERSGRLLPADIDLRYQVIQWLMFQMSGIGPMMGQAMFFQRVAAPKGIISEYATKRYIKESRRLLEIVDHRLKGRHYICDEYSVADIATFPWARSHRWGNIDVSDLDHLMAWFDRMESREAVKRGIRIPTGQYPIAFKRDADLVEATQRNSEKYEA
ncbi:MAG: glutathione S-transferase family protein [Pseudomonadota bacterium]|nr:glutathione S-transferase family protein [Pseudomonadota bacterium]